MVICNPLAAGEAKMGALLKYPTTIYRKGHRRAESRSYFGQAIFAREEDSRQKLPLSFYF
jgi:hypothetical protein